jgi:hypothetical protein
MTWAQPLARVFRIDVSLAIAPMTVVPLPSAAWLLGSGPLGLTGFGRRQLAVRR